MVDDSELVLEVLTEGLVAEGWEVAGATSGAEALARLPAVRPDVVVCDLHMPEMDGFGVLDGVLSFDERIPVIFLSGDEDLGAVLKAIRHGAFDYVPKSDLGLLLGSLERAISNTRCAITTDELVPELRLIHQAATALTAHPGAVGDAGRSIVAATERLFAKVQGST